MQFLEVVSFVFFLEMEQFLQQIDEMERMRDQVSRNLVETKKILSQEQKKLGNGLFVCEATFSSFF